MYEITDKGRERLQFLREETNPSRTPKHLAEGEVLWFLVKSDEEGNAFIENQKNTWRTDGLRSMESRGLIAKLPRQKSFEGF